MKKLLVASGDYDFYTMKLPLSLIRRRKRAVFVRRELEKRHPQFSEKCCADTRFLFRRGKILAEVAVMDTLRLAEYRKKYPGRHLFLEGKPDRAVFIRHKGWKKGGLMATTALAALLLLGRHYLDTTGARHLSQHSIEPAIMNSAITYINEHYMEEMSLEDAALFAGFSKYYFSRMFKRFSGISFLDYLTRKRLNAATELLVHTDQPIQEIARSSGFGSIATFNRVFRSVRSCTPTPYREIYGDFV